MRNSLAAKSARFAVAHPTRCGKCDNCIEADRKKAVYNTVFLNWCGQEPGVTRANLTDARADWLNADRVNPCSDPKPVSYGSNTIPDR